MDNLPAEVVGLIIENVKKTTDLKNLRLVSKPLSTPATKELFSQFSMNLQELKTGADEDAELATSISEINLDNALGLPHLKQAIRTIRYITNLNPNISHEEFYDDGPPNKLTLPMKRLIEKCNKIPNLTTVEVEFAEICSFDDPPDRRRYATQAQDSYPYRTDILEKLFASLNDPEYPTPFLTTLSLKNLQNVNDPVLTKSENFLAVLKRITNLRLRIVTEYEESAPESSWSLPPMHDFFVQLPSTWLAPCADNLTSLTLHCRGWWGYFPKCDWRGVHFSKLKKLELGNYTFSHDWQLNWLLSHGGTLEVLKLDDSPIVPTIRQFGDLDGEKYAIRPQRVMGDTNIWHYETKWADYFLQMQNGLPKLRILQIGSGEWHNGVNFDHAEMRLAQTSSSSGYKQEVSRVHNSTWYNNRSLPSAYPYMYFDRGIGPSPWVDKEDMTEDSDDAEESVEQDDEEEIDIANSPADHKNLQPERDQAAYNELMTIIASRLQK